MVILNHDRFRREPMGTTLPVASSPETNRPQASSTGRLRSSTVVRWYAVTTALPGAWLSIASATSNSTPWSPIHDRRLLLKPCVVPLPLVARFTVVQST